MQEDGLSSPIFEPKLNIRDGETVIPAFTPLQAADICAYEFFLASKKVLTGALNPDERDHWRWPFKALNMGPLSWGEISRRATRS
jgi:hypothetical protein